ncbi:MAG: hypothetical protein PHT07_21345 [Paludibacter sp.]|nr:hypothetical protein [Paludibacter sp.]
MNKDNLIVIKGGSHSDIKKALQQWIELYSTDLETDIKFELYNTGQKNHLIVVDKRLNNEKFNFLVNYLCYPEEIECKISIEGYTTAKKEKLYPENILNKRLIIYISENDKEYDNVFVTTEDNETYKVDFSGKITRSIESKIFKIPDFDFESLSRPEKITLNKTEINEKKKAKSERSIKKRFNVILIIIALLTLINTLSLLVIVNTEISTITTYFLCFGVGSWFFGDYKMLQINKYYNYCLLLATVSLCYSLLIRHLQPYNTDLIKFSSAFPISLIVIQKPLRLIFIRLFKREPIVDKPAPSFLDGVYMLLLFFSSLSLPFIFMNNLK